MINIATQAVIANCGRDNIQFEFRGLGFKSWLFYFLTLQIWETLLLGFTKRIKLFQFFSFAVVHWSWFQNFQEFFDLVVKYRHY